REIKVCSFGKQNIDKSIDYLILGNAFSEELEEVVYAKENNIKVIRYFDFIAKLAIKYNSIAIAGTNGKTTTTGLTSTMLSDQSMIYLIGDGTGVGTVDAKYFLFEACEYKNTFHNYFSKIGVINNIELDHPDFFTSIEHVIETYQGFADQCEKLVVNFDDLNCQKIKHNNIISFGVNNTNADVVMKNIVKSMEGFKFDLSINNKNIENLFLPFQGDHMIYNSLASITISYVMGLDLKKSIKNLSVFSGTSRRFQIEVLDKNKNIILVDDYAHHPTAIKYTISAIKQKYPNYKVSVIFQPHTYSRTKTFLDQFAESLLPADNIYLADIFGSVREQKCDFDISILVDAVEKSAHTVQTDLSFINSNDSNHVIVVLGAGNVDKLYIPEIKKIIKG
ncbi:MAG: Mur ligase family protein, partial [Mycoplasmatales bacterium]